jgi:DNA ligase (NAD+)
VPWSPPTECPVCRTALKRVEGEAALRCPNAVCPGRLKAAVFYFTRRTGMDVDGLGRSLIEQLVDAGLLTNLADVFALPQHRERILELERVGDKSVDNLLVAIDRARTGRSFDRLLTALGIPLVGSVAARLVAERYGNLGTLLAREPAEVERELAEIQGIGPKIASSVAAFMADPDQRATLGRMLALGVQAETTRVEKVEGPLTGKSFCVTGTLSQPREVVHAAILARGGEVHTAVKKGTTYLVAGDKVGKSKLDAAAKKGAEVIDENRLRELLEGRPGVPLEDAEG